MNSLHIVIFIFHQIYQAKKTNLKIHSTNSGKFPRLRFQTPLPLSQSGTKDTILFGDVVDVVDNVYGP